ncbi:MAG: Fe-S cluster assembly protein HesB [Actinomycetota bacterium]|nr:Fe-S cluster assembly protein HesB [Actinomycetota bacterium]
MLHLSQDPASDQLISEDPLALLIGMVLDQQIPLEKAFAGPAELCRRLGGPLDAGVIAAMDPDALIAAFVDRPALHRFPAANAKRVQALCQILVDDYGGDAASVWNGARSGKELLRRVRALPGFGEQKAKIFVALLGKQMAVRPRGWKQVAGEFAESGSRRSVADITDDASLREVRAYKQQIKLRPRPERQPGSSSRERT